jgi:hypothetical protein
MMSLLIVVFAHAFSTAEKTNEDKELIDKIKREILSVSVKRR